MQTKETFKQEMDAQLVEWNTQISQLLVKVERAGTDLKLKYACEINEIRGKQREAVNKIKQLEDASGDAWKKVQATRDKSWYEFRTGLGRIIPRFK